jgi:hypothetical protein
MIGRPLALQAAPARAPRRCLTRDRLSI